ncbi:MAG: ATP-binding protein [Solirubrobacterales bacterium]
MRRFLAGLSAATAMVPAAVLAQGFAPVETGLFPVDLGSAALGAALLGPLALPLVALQRWRIAKLTRRAAAKEAEAARLLECLAAAPEGYYAWMAGDTADVEVCSRRLAVLLGLTRGTQSDWEDVREAFAPQDARLIDGHIDALRSEGEPFDAEFPLIGGNRRVRLAGVRVAGPDGERMADLVWLSDVSSGAAVVEDLARSLQALASETAYFKALIDALPMPVWLRDEDLSLVAVNRAYAHAVDAGGVDAAIAAQIELAADASVREARALAARARAAGEPRSETFHLVLSGERRLTALTEVPVSVGETLLTAGFALDQTRVEELETRLDQHVTAHVEVLERLATAIAIFSPDTKLTFFNTAFARLWRLETEWLTNQPTYALVLDSLRERRLLPEVADYRAYKEEELRRFISLIDPVETVLHLPDGRTLRRLISPHPYGGLVFTYEDVTDTLALERSFNTALAVQRETLDHLHEGIAVFGDDGRLKLFNPSFGRIWSLDASYLAGEPHLHEIVERLKHFFDGRPDRASTWPQVRDRLMGLVDRRSPQDARFERQDGAILDCTSVPLPDGATLLTFLDVTDTARVERALIERNEALAAADLLKSEFIANVSAEVRKPLTSVIGFSEMLSAEYFGKLNKRQHEYAKGITEAGQALQGLVSDILDLATIEAGQMTLELDAADIHPLLTSVLALVRERVREKKISLEFDCPLDIGWIVADQRRLKQVMFNLVGNAVKYTPTGGSVVVRAERAGGELVLTVSDTGPGIPEADRERVFDSFVTINHQAGPSGAGLGLALVRRFVELHGGRIELKDGPEGGTVVVVRLPTAS